MTSLARVFDVDTKISSIGKVSIDLNNNVFVAGVRPFDVTPHEAAIISRLMIISPILRNGFTTEDMTRALRFQTEELFEQAFDALMKKLDDFDVANDSGTGSIYYEDTIKGQDFFKVENGRYSFNKDLALLVSDKPEISEESLFEISYQPRSYKPKGLVL